MSLLRTMSIGGCGTFRSNSKGQPKSIKSELEIRSKNIKQLERETLKLGLSSIITRMVIKRKLGMEMYLLCRGCTEILFELCLQFTV